MHVFFNYSKHVYQKIKEAIRKKHSVYIHDGQTLKHIPASCRNLYFNRAKVLVSF